jgi:hypothetical protein
MSGNRDQLGNHTAIPTPKINILAGVTLTHFTLCALP